MLRNKQSERAFAYTGRTRENHGMGEPILLNCAPENLNGSRVPKKIVQASRVFHVRAWMI
jgi:hypothetical protein